MPAPRKKVTTPTDAAAPLAVGQSGKRSPLGFIVFLLIVLTLGAFARTINQDFTNYDDGLNFYQNPHLNPVPDLNLSHIFGHAYFEMYIPVSYTVFALVSLAARMRRPDPQITMSGGSLDPRVFHGVDLLLHLINVLLVFALLRRLLRATRPDAMADDRGPDDWAAGVGALLFALHPVQVETVAWASQMRGLISGVFSMLALFLAASNRRRSPSRIIAVIILGVLAVLAKPSAVTLPLAAIAIDHWLLKRPVRERLSLAIPWLLAVSPFVFIAGHVQPTPSEIGGPLWARPLIAGDTLAFTLAKLVWPSPLGIDYGRTPGFVLAHWWGYATWIAPTTVAAIVFLVRKRYPWLVAGAVIGLVLEAPVLGLTPFVFQQYSTVADRYLYLVLLGPALVAAFAFREIMPREAIRTIRVSAPVVVAALVLGGCFVLTTRQMTVWDDSVTLMSHALHVNQGSAVAHLNLGSALIARGDARDAVPHLTAALAAQPGNALARTDLGLSYLSLDRPQEAIGVLREATAMAPNDADAHNALGLAYLVTAAPMQAIPEFQAAVRLQPDLAASYDHLGRAYQQIGNLPNAAASYRHALLIDPLLFPVYDRLGDVLAAQGDYQEASAVYETALGHDPSDLDASLGLSGIDARQGNPASAVQVLRFALSFHPDDARVQRRLNALMK